jgi:hypothetical protein
MACHHFDLAVCGEIQRFEQEFAVILLAANHAYAPRDEVHQRDAERLGVHAHHNQPAIWPQSLDGILHRRRGIPVARITSAPPAFARLAPSRTISSAPNSRIMRSLSAERETAIV